MSNINLWVIEGHLTRNAELGYFNDDQHTAYCNFSIACNESYKKADGTYDNVVSFFDCAMKGKFAEAWCRYLLKGRGLTVTGRAKQQRWEKDGQKFSRVVLKVENLSLKPNTNNENVQQEQNYNVQQNEQFTPKQNDDYPVFIPFEGDPEEIL